LQFVFVLLCIRCIYGIRSNLCNHYFLDEEEDGHYPSFPSCLRHHHLFHHLLTKPYSLQHVQQEYLSLYHLSSSHKDIIYSISIMTDYVVMETREDLKNYLRETTADITIIKLTATWCRPCKIIEPTLTRLNNEYMSKNINYEYIELDVDHATDIYAFFKKMRMANGIPTILCFKKNMYTDSHYYVPFKCMTGADINAVTQFFQICLQ